MSVTESPGAAATEHAAAVSQPGRLSGVVAWFSVRRLSVGGTPFAAFAFAGLVALLWAPFGPRNGMGYETGFPFMSQTSSFYDGFRYVADPLRINTNFFYQLSYVIGQALGIKGSYVPYQVVYALLWFGRGLLAFLIVRRLVPRSQALAYAVGALVVVHASDHALNWVGQMNQFGMIYWLLLAVFLLVVSLQASTPGRAILAIGLSALSTYMCLWSYESGFFIVLAVPVLLLFIVGRNSRSVATVAAFYVVPLVYLAESIHRYATVGSQTYQSTVMRHDRQITHLLSDLWFNIRASLEFWHWSDGFAPAHAATQTTLSVGAAAAFVVGGALLVWRRRDYEQFPTVRIALSVVAVGALLLVLSFPAYVLLTSARLLWRTQFLSGIGAGLFLGGLAALAVAVARAVDRRATVVGVMAAVAFGGAVSYAGASAAYRAGAFHYGVWERHRVAVVEVLHAAPRLEPNSLVVLTNVPKTADPFGDNMWFDFAMRMAYPNESVSGVYYYAHGASSPSDPLQLAGAAWKPTGVGYPPLVQNPTLDHTVVVRFEPNGRGKLLLRLPRFLAQRAHGAAYVPTGVVESGPPSPMAQRRYDP